MSAKMRVKSSRGPYEISFLHQTEEVVDYVNSFLSELSPSMVVVFSNQTVSSLYGTVFLEQLRIKHTVKSVLFPDGEEFKTLETIQHIIQELDVFPIDRKTVFVALGGGVVGDMTGFLASIFVRGVDWIQVPTTLLAMVDSSVGGKTGINLPSGKNRLGTFYPPNLVCSTPQYLQTLDKAQLQSGLGEVFKHCLLDSYKMVERFENEIIAPSEWLSEQSAIQLIIDVCAVKARVVEADELEKGVRKTLNFGHTIGHALEKVLEYGSLLHGQAVLIGMWIEAAWAASKGWTEAGVVESLENVCIELDMSIEIRDTITSETLFDAISFDKKMQCDKLQLVVLENFGFAAIRDLDREDMLKLSEFASCFLSLHYSSPLI
jgi:3-dehydroquinate synthase